MQAYRHCNQPYHGHFSVTCSSRPLWMNLIYETILRNFIWERLLTHKSSCGQDLMEWRREAHASQKCIFVHAPFSFSKTKHVYIFLREPVLVSFSYCLFFSPFLFEHNVLPKNVICTTLVRSGGPCHNGPTRLPFRVILNPNILPNYYTILAPLHYMSN